jgi:hypothetical protein
LHCTKSSDGEEFILCFYIQFLCYFHEIHAIKRSFYGDYNLIESIKIVGMEHFTGTDGNWEHRTF